MGRSFQPEISITVPVFNEDDANLELVLARLRQSLSPLEIDYEVIFIDDGSDGMTNSTLKRLALENDNVRLVVLSRNFGEMAAISAGLAHVSGKAMVNMDSDLQDPPELIPRMIQYWRQGYDVVFMQQSTRKESAFRQFWSYSFYRLLVCSSYVRIPKDTAEFRLMSRRVVDALLSMPEKTRFLRGLVPWLGFKQIVVPFDRDERRIGEGRYPAGKLLELAINGLMAFNYGPLYAIALGGFLLMSLGLSGMICCALSGTFKFAGLDGALVSLLVSLSGLHLFSLGIVAAYLAEVLKETRARPAYVVSERVGWRTEEFSAPALATSAKRS